MLSAQKLDQHLAAAIEEFSKPQDFSAAKKESEPKMRGMRRLASLTEGLMDKVDQVADQAADEVQAATDYALDAVGKFKDQAADIRRTADDILSQLGQKSNMPPPAPPKVDPPPKVEETGTAATLPEVKLGG
jgi:hypothetical protein